MGGTDYHSAELGDAVSFMQSQSGSSGSEDDVPEDDGPVVDGAGGFPVGWDNEDVVSAGGMVEYPEYKRSRREGSNVFEYVKQ